MESLRTDTTVRKHCRGWSARYVRRACLWRQRRVAKYERW